MIRSNRLASVALLVTLAACSFANGPSLPVANSGRAPIDPLETGAGKITHIVYVVQENRSFDDLFQGYPGADTVSTGKNSKDQTIALKPVSLKTQYDIDHSVKAMFAACNGTGKLPGTDCRMNGFNNENIYGGPANPQYVYVPHAESKPYFDMAHEWVLADKMFQSQLDESFVAHQYIIAAQAGSAMDLPYGAWGCSGGSGDTVFTIGRNRKLWHRTTLLRLSNPR